MMEVCAKERHRPASRVGIAPSRGNAFADHTFGSTRNRRCGKRQAKGQSSSRVESGVWERSAGTKAAWEPAVRLSTLAVGKCADDRMSVLAAVGSSERSGL